MEKRTRRKSDNASVRFASVGSAVAARANVAARADVAEGDIARLAYELYCQRGREHGRDLDDWLAAERLLRGRVRAGA